MQSLFFIALLFAAAYYLYTTILTREIANATAQRICRENNFQLLDGTVYRLSSRICWKKRLSLLRRYQFEYSTQGDDRNSAYMTLNGRRLVQILFKEPQP